MSKRELEFTNVKSHIIVVQEIDLMRRTDLHGEVDVKFKMSQGIEIRCQNFHIKYTSTTEKHYLTSGISYFIVSR